MHLSLIVIFSGFLGNFYFSLLDGWKKFLPAELEEENLFIIDFSPKRVAMRIVNSGAEFLEMF